MSYRAIYAYAWDLAERPVAKLVSEFKSLGLDTVTLAGSYHAGKFLRPKGTDGKVYFPGGRHRLFPRRSEALWQDQAGRQQPQRRPRLFRELDAAASR